MEKIHHHNPTASTIYVGGVAIPAGASRLVDPRSVPGLITAAAEAAPAGNPLLDLLDQPVAAIVAKLPDLSHDELGQVESAEKDGKTRKGVLTGITEERLHRAKAAEEAEAHAKAEAEAQAKADAEAGNA